MLHGVALPPPQRCGLSRCCRTRQVVGRGRRAGRVPWPGCVLLTQRWQGLGAGEAPGKLLGTRCRRGRETLSTHPPARATVANGPCPWPAWGGEHRGSSWALAYCSCLGRAMANHSPESEHPLELTTGFAPSSGGSSASGTCVCPRGHMSLPEPVPPNAVCLGTGTGR